MHRAWLALLGLLLAAPVGAYAEVAAAPTPEIAVRTGDHPGYGRVVFDFASHASYRLTRDGDHVQLLFDGDPAIGTARALPRNVRALSGGIGQADLTVVKGAGLRESRVGERVVIDVLDAGPAPDDAALPVPPVPPAMAPLQPVAHSQPQAAPVVPAAVVKPEPPMPAAPMTPSPRVAAPETEQRNAAGVSAADLGPLALVARKVVLPPDVAGSAFSVPFGAGVGATALRRGEVGLVVFDEKRPIDLAALRDDPVLGSASVQMLPAATIIRVRLPVGREIALSRATPEAWTVSISATPARFHPIQAGGEGGTLLLSADAPGQVVSIVDPESGAILLLGTQRQPGQGVAVFRRTPQFGLPPTWQGVAVQPLADSLTLRATKRGFVLAGGDTKLALAMPVDPADILAGATALTRRFDFPLLSSPALLRHMQAQLSDAAMAPKLARGQTAGAGADDDRARPRGRGAGGAACRRRGRSSPCHGRGYGRACRRRGPGRRTDRGGGRDRGPAADRQRRGGAVARCARGRA